MLPIVGLVAGRIFGFSRSNSFLLALIVAVLELAGWAALAGRRHQLPLAQRVVAIVSACAFGLLIIALKVALH